MHGQWVLSIQFIKKIRAIQRIPVTIDRLVWLAALVRYLLASYADQVQLISESQSSC
jgi:hypothetical protein